MKSVNEFILKRVKNYFRLMIDQRWIIKRNFDFTQYKRVHIFNAADEIQKVFTEFFCRANLCPQ